MPAIAQLSPPLVVMLSLIGLLALVIIVAMLKYKTADEALKIMAFIAPVLTLVVGAAATHFFGEQRIEEVKQFAADTANGSARAAMSVADNLVSIGDLAGAREILTTTALFSTALSPDVLDQHALRIRELPAPDPVPDPAADPASPRAEASPAIELGAARYLARTGSSGLAAAKLKELQVRPNLSAELQAEIRSIQRELSEAPR